MRMSVIVPVRDDAGRLARCLASVTDIQGPDRAEIIVVDNGSVDDSPGVAARAGATVLSLPNLKVSALRNAAARQAQGDLLAFIDADHQLGPGWSMPLMSDARPVHWRRGFAISRSPRHGSADGVRGTHES
jgi:glycosyltransferase involved in cell wall biosynthesis